MFCIFIYIYLSIIKKKICLWTHMPVGKKITNDFRARLLETWFPHGSNPILELSPIMVASY